MNAKKRGGRPSKLDDEKRHLKLTVHLCQSEYNLVKNKSLLSKQNMSSFLRNCALKKEIKNYEHLVAVLAELNRIGNNLNQVTKILNSDTKLFDSNQMRNLELFMIEFRLIIHKILKNKEL